MKKLLIATALLLASCTSVNQGLDPKIFYRREAGMKVNGIEAQGVYVAPRSGAYEVEIKTQGKLDLLTVTSCHREITAEKLSSGVFGKNAFKLSYVPSPGIEDVGVCPLTIGGFEAEKGRHTWGFIDFETPGTDLSASTTCNGVVQSFRGVSVCQSRVGLIQKISFQGPVKAYSDNCELPEVKGNEATYQVAPGECLFLFVEQDGLRRRHRHTQIGYEQIVIYGD